MLSVVVSPARALIAKATIPPHPPISLTAPYPSARVARKDDLAPGHQVISEYQFGAAPISIERDDVFVLHACNKAPTDMKMRPFRDILQAADTSVVTLHAAHKPLNQATVVIPVGSSRMFLVDVRVKAVVTVLASAALSLTFHAK